MNRFALLPLFASTLLATGCASIYYPSHDDLKVFTDPPGATASCGDTRVVTPGTLRISRRKTPSVVVRVELAGYETREVVIARNHVLPGKPWGVFVLAALLAAWAGERCDSGEIVWDGCQETTLAVAAGAGALGAGGILVDSASPRTYALPRNDLVLRLEPVRPTGAQEGELR
jgi:hypothetical protein